MSTISVLPVACSSCVPLALPVASVPTFGTVTVCPSSSTSACVATSRPSCERLSKATSVLPVVAVPSNSNVTCAVPSGSSGVNVVVAVTSAPPDWIALPVALSTRVPVSAYSFPGTRFA